MKVLVFQIVLIFTISQVNGLVQQFTICGLCSLKPIPVL